MWSPHVKHPPPTDFTLPLWKVQMARQYTTNTINCTKTTCHFWCIWKNIFLFGPNNNRWFSVRGHKLCINHGPTHKHIVEILQKFGWPGGRHIKFWYVSQGPCESPLRNTLETQWWVYSSNVSLLSFADVQPNFTSNFCSCKKVPSKHPTCCISFCWIFLQLHSSVDTHASGDKLMEFDIFTWNWACSGLKFAQTWKIQNWHWRRSRRIFELHNPPQWPWLSL